ncbi:MAG: laminin G domain-containing protein [Kiritimatiellae bacterium]|nr:laminin G domain-containing protein [Kiritimatiellia bacterium]
MKHLKMQFLIAIAAVAAGMFSLQARTVAWYHFNEGENGYAPTGYPAIVTNAAAPGTLTGYPYRQTGCMSFGGAAGANLPTYTNAFSSSMTWYDPVTGERATDGKGMYFSTAGGDGSGNGSAVLVTDNAALHCERITVECMMKVALGANKTALASWTHLLTMRNADQASTPSNTKNIKAWGMIVNASGNLVVQAQVPLSDGSAADTSLSMTDIYTSGVNLADGNWHHVAITYDQTTMRVYIDYALRASREWGHGLTYGTASKNRLCIGTFDATTYGRWQGFIDEVRISDEALPPEQFLRIVDVAAYTATDADTVLYLPFNSTDFTPFNSATSAVASMVDMRLSTDSKGVYPRFDAGVSAVVSNELHSGIFAANTIMNEGCWTYTNNPAYPEYARYIIIDDFSKNNNTHLITSGDFTAEFFLKVPTTPTSTSRVLVENTGAKGAGNIQLTVTANYLYCTLYSQEEIDKYEAGTVSAMTATDFYTPVSNVVGGDWHHVALVVDKTNRRAALYLDGKSVRIVENFVLASGVSTHSNNDYRFLKIGEGWGGSSATAIHGLSIDEFRITRRALVPQEFLTKGVASDASAREELENGTTRAWIAFEGDLNVGPNGSGVVGSSTATTVSMTYSSDVPGVPGGKLLDGNNNVIREANLSSMCFSGAYGSGDTSPDTASQRLFFGRNVLLERDMKSMTVEFFMKGTRNAAKGWATILRMYGNDTGSDSSPFRRLWSLGYKDAAGHIYVIKDINDASQTSFYPDDNVSLADGRWHHIAITFAPDGTGKTLCNVYKDYKPLGSQHTFNGEMECDDYGASSMAIGSRYNGYIDEVRVSKGVLSVDQMLHVEKRGYSILIR